MEIIIGFTLIAAAATFVLAPAGFCAGIAALKAAPAPIQFQNTSVARQAKQQAPSAIPLADIASQATAVSTYLGSIGTLASADATVQKIKQDFPELAALIDRDMPEATRLVREQASLAQLQTQEQLWKARQLQLTQWLAVLTGRADQLQAAMDQLELLRRTWNLTRAAAVTAKAPPQIIQQIDALLATIGTARVPLNARRSAVLIIQDQIAGQLTSCGKLLADLTTAQQSVMESILRQDTPPVWSAELWNRAREELPGKISLYRERCRADLLAFAGGPSRILMMVCGYFALIAVVASIMRRRIDAWAGAEELPPDVGVFRFPLAIALFGALYYGSAPRHLAPQAARLLMVLLSIFPMVRLVRPVVQRRAIPVLYMLGLLFALDAVRQGVAGAPLLEQAILLVESAAGIGVLWRFLADLSLGAAGPDAGLTGTQRFGRVVAWLIILNLVISCGAVIFGYLRLARLLTSSVLVGSILALALFIFVRIMAGAIAFCFRIWPLASLRMVSNHRHLLERRSYKLIIWVAAIGWVARCLEYTGLLASVLDFGRTALAARFVRGSFSISLGDVAAFGLTVWLAFLVSSFIRFVLNEDVFPRTRTSPGVSYAVSSLLRYLFIVIGFMAGLGMLGVTMDRVIILVSAFGVGIGFGMQNIVNNFISGLVLLFERPVHVGDTVEFGAINGEVREIGIRSSKVHTWQGADIIVPNSQLVTESVTNWTLSDQLRRIDLPVGVNYGADPQTVIDLLKGVAQKNPRILAWPECACLKKEFGDSTINFELRAWTDDFSNWSQIRSELAVAVYDAVRAAGMSFPFPQREVRLLRDVRHEPVATALSDVPPAMQSESVGKSGPET